MTSPAAGRTDAPETEVVLRALLEQVIPERGASLRIEEVADRARLLLAGSGVSATVYEETLTVRTVRYYRTKDIVSAPVGEVRNARYGARHVLEAAVARLAGHLHHLSLADAAERIRGLDEDGLLRLLAELVRLEREGQRPRRLPGRVSAPAATNGSATVAAEQSVTLRLPRGVILVVPADHPALRSGVPPDRIASSISDAVDRLLD